MQGYIVTGRLGEGKTLISVSRIRDALDAGQRVATNLDLKLEHLMPSHSKATVTRLPDKPRLSDLEAIGYGYPEDEPYDEERFGLLVLDECSTWLNSRAWQDKERAPVLNWFLHARKFRWNLMFLAQSEDALDKQLVEQVCPYTVVCKNLSRLRVPFLGSFLSIFSDKAARLPKIHVASVWYGAPVTGIYTDRWVYRGTDLYAAYNTGQVFSSGHELVGGELRDMRATYTQLSAWHLQGRYEQPALARPPLWRRALLFIMRAYLLACCYVGGVLTGRGARGQAEAWGLLRS